MCCARARFTLAHEFGHYLLHRHLVAAGELACSADDIARGQAAGRSIEREADDSDAALLMPSTTSAAGCRPGIR